ncbi:MAG: hypothetical protein FWF50_05795 [Defluviitaleaceae bacterium]|nr:hypothetical protein [Defluviitaleaceae bacterium]
MAAKYDLQSQALLYRAWSKMLEAGLIKEVQEQLKQAEQELRKETSE